MKYNYHFLIIIENERNHQCVYSVDKTFMIIENDIFLKHEIAKKVSCNFYIQKGKEKLEKEKYINSHGSVEKNSNTWTMSRKCKRIQTILKNDETDLL